MTLAIKEHIEKHEACVECKFTKFTICRIRYSITYLVTFSYKSGYYIKRPLLSRLCCTIGYYSATKHKVLICDTKQKMTLGKNDTWQK